MPALRSPLLRTADCPLMSKTRQYLYTNVYVVLCARTPCMHVP